MYILSVRGFGGHDNPAPDQRRRFARGHGAVLRRRRSSGCQALRVRTLQAGGPRVPHHRDSGCLHLRRDRAQRSGAAEGGRARVFDRGSGRVLHILGQRRGLPVRDAPADGMGFVRAEPEVVPGVLRQHHPGLRHDRGARHRNGVLRELRGFRDGRLAQVDIREPGGPGGTQDRAAVIPVPCQGLRGQGHRAGVLR